MILLIFETIIAMLAFMTYIVDLNAYELHLGDVEVFNNFMMNAKVLHLKYIR